MTALAKILLVDDEREFVAILTQRLTKRKYSVVFTHSGKDALAQLAEDKDIEVVILDVKMPGLDGIETLKLVREQLCVNQGLIAANFKISLPTVLPDSSARWASATLSKG